MNTVSVKKTMSSNIHVQMVEIQYKMHGHHLVNYNEIHENLQAFVSLDKMSLNSDNRGLDNWLRMHCNQFSTSNYAMKIIITTFNFFSTNAASFYGGGDQCQN